jgi:AcrR family transcriptional regulator
VASLSDAPARPPGVRARSGNAMLRTRASLLAGAADCVARLGVRRTSMTEVAAAAGVAKATLYNHFRTKDDVLVALVEAQVAQLVRACAELAAAEGAEQALVHAAACIAASPPLRRVADEEPALLAVLAGPSEARAWEEARAGLQAVLAHDGEPSAPQVELALRWLVSQLLWPLPAEQAREQAQALLAGRAGVRAQLRLGAEQVSAGLGWPALASGWPWAGRSPDTSAPARRG